MLLYRICTRIGAILPYYPMQVRPAIYSNILTKALCIDKSYLDRHIKPQICFVFYTCFSSASSELCSFCYFLFLKFLSLNFERLTLNLYTYNITIFDY